MTQLKSGDILKPSRFGMLFPAGVLSMAGFAMWFLLLMLPVVGLINKPDIVIRDVKNAAPELWLALGGAVILIILLQIVFRMMVKRKRILIDDRHICMKGVFSSKEVEIVNVKTINKIADRAALCTHITLVYQDRSRAKISGWLMKWREMDALADYIYNKNSN